MCIKHSFSNLWSEILFYLFYYDQFDGRLEILKIETIALARINFVILSEGLEKNAESVILVSGSAHLL